MNGMWITHYSFRATGMTGLGVGNGTGLPSIRALVIAGGGTRTSHSQMR